MVFFWFFWFPKPSKDVFFGFFGKPKNHLFFPRKKLVFLPKTIFFLGKVGFSRQNHLFPEKPRYFTPRPSFSKQRVCFSCVVCARYVLSIQGPNVITIAIRVRLASVLYNRPGNNQDIIRISFGANRKLVSQL